MAVVAVSLKMYFTPERTQEYCRAVRAGVAAEPELAGGRVRLAILPDFLSIPLVAPLLDSSGIWLGAQDLAPIDRGAMTGEVSGTDLAGFGVRVVEIGHAERRTIFGESDQMVADKMAAAARNGLVPLLCVGEPERTDPAEAARLCIEQIDDACRGLDLPELWIGYEPYWAIGAPQPAPADYVQAVCRGIRAGLALPGDVVILYGGSAGPGLLASLDGTVDGLFLGRFAHDPNAFIAVAREAASLTQ